MLSIKDAKTNQFARGIHASDLFRYAAVDAASAERTGDSNYSYWGATLRVFRKNKIAMTMLFVLLALLVFTLIRPSLPGQRAPGFIHNHPATGMQLSNQAPSFDAALTRIPAGMRLFAEPYDANWYEATNVVGAITKRTAFTVVEYGDAWCFIARGEMEGYAETRFLKLPDPLPAGAFEAVSNDKLTLHFSPANVTNGGDPVYIRKSDVHMLDRSTGQAETSRAASIYTIPAESGFWFGTNNIGQDLWARVWAGTRTSLFIGAIVALVEAVVGICAGVLWGYVRRLDRVLTEVYNVLDNIPSTVVLILISYIMKPGLSTVIFAMCLTGWLGMARFVRNQIVIIRDRDYNLASRCLGTSAFRMIARNLLPYLVSVIALRMALAIPGAIGSEVFITYIGLGLPADIPSLGNLINAGRQLITSPALRYQLIFPALVLSVITISFYIIGNAFADAADPKNHV